MPGVPPARIGRIEGLFSQLVHRPRNGKYRRIPDAVVEVDVHQLQKHYRAVFARYNAHTRSRVRVYGYRRGMAYASRAGASRESGAEGKGGGERKALEDTKPGTTS